MRVWHVLTALAVSTAPMGAQSTANGGSDRLGVFMRAGVDLSAIMLWNDRLFFGPGVSLGAGYGLSDRLSILATGGFTNKLAESRLGFPVDDGSFDAQQADVGARYAFARSGRYEFFSEAALGLRRMRWEDRSRVCTPGCGGQPTTVTTVTKQSGVGGSVTLGFASYTTSRWRGHWAVRRGFARYLDVQSTDSRLAVPINATITTLELGARLFLGS